MNNKQLSLLSDEKLLDQTKLLVQKERDINFQVLRHLEEIEVRKLYLSRGFSSLLNYAIKELGYSGSAAYRRVKAMRLCKETPEVEAKLKSGKLNLTTALQLQQFFEKTQEKNKEKTNKKNQAYFNFKSVDESIKSRTTVIGETEEIILNKNQENKNLMIQNNRLQERTMDCSKNIEGVKNFQETGNMKQTGYIEETQKSILNKTQKINLIKKVEGKSSREVEKILTQLTNKEVFLKDRIKYVGSNKIKMNIVVHERCLTNLEKLKHLLSHKNPNMCYGDLLFLLSEIALDKHDPKRRYERRLHKKENSVKKQLKDILPPITDKKMSDNKKVHDVCHKQKRKNLTTGRYIPNQVREYIWTRDQGQCTYVCSKTNQKCSSKHLLQIDHIQPFSLGGSHSSKNLRLLCAFHNQYRNRINENKKTQSLSV